MERGSGKTLVFTVEESRRSRWEPRGSQKWNIEKLRYFIWIVLRTSKPLVLWAWGGFNLMGIRLKDGRSEGDWVGVEQISSMKLCVTQAQDRKLSSWGVVRKFFSELRWVSERKGGGWRHEPCGKDFLVKKYFCRKIFVTRFQSFMCEIVKYALVVQWIELRTSKPLMLVRFQPRAQNYKTWLLSGFLILCSRVSKGFCLRVGIERRNENF